MTTKAAGHGTDAWRLSAAPVRSVPVVVIGAGQAGLSAAYYLRRRGLEYVVLDGEAGPGGAWRHRWRSLRLATVNGIFDLPGMPSPPADPDDPAADAVPRYFAAYEQAFGFPIRRPVHVLSVRRAAGHFAVSTDHGTWTAQVIINATGTWTTPNRPWYPGQDTFGGRQLHAAEYTSAEEFRGKHVIVVGGGITAVQLLEEISRVTTTTWVTRREPVWLDGDFTPEAGGRATVARVEADARRGLPIGSIVSYTGLGWTPYARAAAARGALRRHPAFTAIETRGVRMADGTFEPADVILWATGFRQALDHLAPLRLRGDLGGIAMDGTAVAADPRLHLIGYGPSQSTIGANRAGRDATAAIARLLLPSR